MALLRNSALRVISGMSNSDMERAMDFFQGAVYCWCKNRPDEWFALRNLMGGENTYWLDTPLAIIYRKYAHLSDSEAFEAAAKDAGWILKRVISSDKRLFDTEVRELVRHYRWTPEGLGST